MPTAEGVLSFSNPWYESAVASARHFQIAEEISILIPHPALFLATKWAAAADRGKDDPIASRDIADIIAVIAGRPSILDEIAEAEPEVRSWLANKTIEFLESPDADYALQGALPDAALIRELIPEVRERLQGIVRLGGGVA